MQQKPVLRYLRLILFLLTFSQFSFSQQSQLKITIDGSKSLQHIDGIGVNANTRSWDGENLQPALDLLIDSLNANIWRVIVETVDGWEVTNDNNDPFAFNWRYYDSLYETPKFTKAWEMIDYLNKRGITDNIVINFMGFAPAWMGNKIIEPKYEDEYVEMILSFFNYALQVKKLKFGFIAPTNESDHHQFSEGPHLTGEQHARILRKLIDRMDRLGVGRNIRLIAPDNANPSKSYDEFLPAMMKDTVVMKRTAHLGFHSYMGNLEEVQPYIHSSKYPDKTFWVTEWNTWCNGCDDGILGDYNYEFAKKSVTNLLKLIESGARACLLWEAYDSYYSHHAPSKFSYWGVLGYDSINKKYLPRKHFYAIQQVSKFVSGNSTLLSLTKSVDSMHVLAFVDSTKHQLVITGVNAANSSFALLSSTKNIRLTGEGIMYVTDESNNLKQLTVNATSATIPANCIFTLVMELKPFANAKPEPSDWYAGDIHVHRNCGDSTVHSEEEVKEMMKTNDLAIMSLLADMGNAEVKDSKTDLPKVTGNDIKVDSGKIMRWDTEWHWDATYSQFSNQALGGHLVLLGLNNAKQIWEESPYKILEWAKQQNAVRGFAHFQYLNDKVQKELNCCIPVDYPVEAALGTIDFVSEDVFSSNMQPGGSFSSEAVTNAYYKLLNCGFRLGLAAGTDYPCNNNEPPGSLLTYAKVKGPLTYRKWIDAIRDGKTVVSRNGHKEFIDLHVNNTYSIGDDVKLSAPGEINIAVKWTSSKPFSGLIELVHNGDVIASQEAKSQPGKPFVFQLSRNITSSGWICARRMSENGHELHTAPVYITVNNQPVRANSKDARFFVSWIDNILENIAPGKPWNRYFTKDRQQVIARYEKARNIFKKIAQESDHAPLLVVSSAAGFGKYTTEILKAEGLNFFSSSVDTNFSFADLKNRKAVIIASENLGKAQIDALTQYVNKGGNLIATVSNKSLQNIFGVSYENENAEAKYLQLTQSSITKGLTTSPMRIHVNGTNYKTTTATSLAYFNSDKKNPAVVLNKFGAGQAISFLYNLPENIVLTRQGNPIDAGKEMDSIPGLRAMDLFTSGWVDSSNNTINHADEQMRLLSRCIEYMCRDITPLPKLWYFPDTLSCVVTLNNDGEDSKESEFEPQFQDVYAKGAKMTLYVKEVDLVSKEWSDKWRARGYEISGHPDQTKHAADPDWQRMDSIYKALNAKLWKSLNVPSMTTVTNHWFVWPGVYNDGKKDFAAQAKLEELNGVALDCNYAHYDNKASQELFLGSHGYTQGNYTGSGLPMKFADAEGNIINVYQQLNNVYDQQYMEHDDKNGYFNAFKGLMDRSIDSGVYSFICVRAHNNEYFFSKMPLMEMLDYANERKVPVWSEEMLLSFLLARDACTFSNIQYSNNRLKFTLDSPVRLDGKFGVVVPYMFGGKKVSAILSNGKKIQLITRSVKDQKFVLIPAKSGVSGDVEVVYQ